MTKGALCTLTRAAALELAADGVRCNVVLPGADGCERGFRDARILRGRRGISGNWSTGRRSVSSLRPSAPTLPGGRRTDALHDRASGRRRGDAPARHRVTTRTGRRSVRLALSFDIDATEGLNVSRTAQACRGLTSRHRRWHPSTSRSLLNIPTTSVWTGEFVAVSSGSCERLNSCSGRGLGPEHVKPPCRAAPDMAGRLAESGGVAHGPEDRERRVERGVWAGFVFLKTRSRRARMTAMSRRTVSRRRRTVSTTASAASSGSAVSAVGRSVSRTKPGFTT